jgi:hypothetical protein
LLINILLTNSRMENVRRHVFHRQFHILSLSLSKKKTYQWFYKRKIRAKKNSRLKYTERYILLVIVVYAVNICSKYFSTLGKMLTDSIRL